MKHEAILAHMNGRLDEARAAYETALDEGAGNLRFHRAYAWLLVEMGERDHAVEVLRRALAGEGAKRKRKRLAKVDRDPPHDGLFLKDSSAAGELAMLLFYAGELREAKNLARRAISDNPSDRLAHEILVEILAEEDDVDGAKDLYDGAPDSVRASFFVCKALARILAVSGRFDDSLRVRNTGLNLPEKSLSAIDGHVLLPITTRHMIPWREGEPDPEVTPLDIKADGPESPRYVSLNEAIVLSGEWMVVSHAQTLFMDLNHGTPTGDPTPYYKNPDNSKANIVLLRPQRGQFDKAILVGGDPNYFHWLIEFLPKLMAIARTPGLDDYPILIHEALLPYQREGLAMAGIPEERLRTLAYPGCYACRELVVPLFPPDTIDTPAPRARRAAVSWLRTLAVPSEGGRRRIYVTRRDSSRRRIVNENVLAEVLAAEGFDILTLSNHSMKEQMAIFSQAEMIVAGHGAGLANLAFAPADCRVVEIVEPVWDLSCFEALAAIRGQPYRKVKARTFIAERILPIHHDSFLTEQTVDHVLRLVRAPRPGGTWPYRRRAAVTVRGNTVQGASSR